MKTPLLTLLLALTFVFQGISLDTSNLKNAYKEVVAAYMGVNEDGQELAVLIEREINFSAEITTTFRVSTSGFYQGAFAVTLPGISSLPDQLNATAADGTKTITIETTANRAGSKRSIVFFTDGIPTGGAFVDQ